MRRQRLAIVLDSLPPWLVTNLNAVQVYNDLAVIETTPQPKFDLPTSTIAFRRCRLTTSVKNSVRFQAELDHMLLEFDPDVVLTLGWTGMKNIVALEWCMRRGVPSIVSSDSKADDFKRIAYRECAKGYLIRQFTTGWAAGARAASYLQELGMPAERVVVGPVDTVDIYHFEKGANAARSTEFATRRLLKLPKRYFLTVCRLAPEKNLRTLVQAYSYYRNVVEHPWSLVIVGEGPLRVSIEQEVERLGVSKFVSMPGWVKFDELPSYYGLASAFVLASTKDTWGCVVNEAAAASLPLLISRAAGCADDLVKQGANGFTFDPTDVGELAHLLENLTRGGVNLDVMGAESRRIVNRWSPQCYAESLSEAVRTAINSGPARATWVERLMVRTLAVKELRAARNTGV